MAKNSGGVTTFYVWDNENLIAEYNGAGQRTKRYAYIPNRYAALQVEDANGIYQVHTNHLDTPTQLTDSAQKIVWQANYQAFGNTNINQHPDANGIAIIYNQRFPGQYQDVETNLYYNFYRDYDPSTGRYLQSDPIGLGGGINVYGYVLGNPVRRVDPTGTIAVVLEEAAAAAALCARFPAQCAAGAAGLYCLINPSACKPKPDCPNGSPPLLGQPQPDNPLMNSGSGSGKEKSPNSRKPKNTPSGTKDIDKVKDKYGWDKDTLHGIKDAAHGGMSTGESWTGVAPDGTVGINEGGEWSPQGHWEDLQ